MWLHMVMPVWDVLGLARFTPHSTALLEVDRWGAVSASGPSFVLNQEAADEVRDCHKMQLFTLSLIQRIMRRG